MEKLIKKCSKKLIWKTKAGYLNEKNVILKNNEKNRKQFLKMYIKKIGTFI